MRRAAIEEQNRYLLERQRQFRMAADVVTMAKALWKEVPRFSEFRRERVEVWHECGDLDLALWLASQERLGELRRAAVLALRKADENGTGIGVASHQLDVFLIEPGSDRCYLGRLCSFNACPKGRRDRLAPDCGATPFNRHIEGFTPHPDLLASARDAMLYQRGAGRLRSALDLPTVIQDCPPDAARRTAAKRH